MILSSNIDLISRLKRANEVNCLEDSGISFHNFSPHIWIDFWLDSNLVVIIFDLLVERKLYECVSFSLFRSKWLVIETGSRCLFCLYINLLFSKNTALLTSRIPSLIKIKDELSPYAQRLSTSGSISIQYKSHTKFFDSFSAVQQCFVMKFSGLYC